MSSLPLLSELLSSLDKTDVDSPLATTLSTLFEPSPVLTDKLVPEFSALQSSVPLQSYASLIDVALRIISSWDLQTQASFIAAHPRIGEVKNLSHLSQQEQAAKATSSEVLSRLAQLNAIYERRYPGLRYITFVNGRSRAAIKDELEAKLGVPQDWVADDSDFLEKIVPVQVGSPEWLEELDRAVGDVGRIAKNRLGALGVV